MSFPLWDLAKDIAVARGGKAVKTDPMDRPSSWSMRTRVAAMLSIPGMAVAAAVGSWFDNWVAGLAALIVVGAALWFYAARGLKRDASADD